MAKVLVIDDEENICSTLKDILQDDGHEVVLANDGVNGLQKLTEEQPDIVLLDIQLPKKDGLTLLEEIKELRTGCEVIMISGHGTIDLAVKAIKKGAYHFLQKPLSLIEVKQNVRHAALLKQQRDELTAWRQNEDNKYQLIGQSRSIEQIKQIIQKVGPTNGRVLITGESGTGKEIVAYWIHKYSLRASFPFVKINCAAIPQNLIESELFGHEKGSFTGAISQKKGKFEIAHGGTLFLDEIGDMDINTQTKVLRAIQEGEFERVGGIKTIKVDVRVLAATHRDIQAMIKENKFREDLFYRLNVVPIHVPPLSERIEDIPILANHFLELYCRENGILPRFFTQEALAFLTMQRYPGNVRELRNIVERIVILSDSPQISRELVESLIKPQAAQNNALFVNPRPLAQAKFELEKYYVETQLQLHNWDVAKTAHTLGLHRTNLHRKIAQLGIRKKD